MHSQVASMQRGITLPGTRLAQAQKKEWFPPAHQLLTIINKIRSSTICITCFCENGDLLSQWRGYSAHGYGYSLGFDTTILRERAASSGFILGRCIYDPMVQDKIINEAVGYLLRLGAPDNEKER